MAGWNTTKCKTKESCSICRRSHAENNISDIGWFQVKKKKKGAAAVTGGRWEGRGEEK